MGFFKKDLFMDTFYGDEDKDRGPIRIVGKFFFFPSRLVFLFFGAFGDLFTFLFSF